MVGASLLVSSAQAQIPCLSTATQPVRRFFEDTRYGAGEMQRAADEVRLNQRRVELERRTVQLSQEYATYNADVHSYLHYNFVRQPNTSLFLPQPTGLWSPNSTGAYPSEPWPANPTSVQSGHQAPVQQAPQAPPQQVYPPVPTQVLPQPNGVYNPLQREQSLMYNDYGYQRYIPAYTAQQPGPYRF